MKRAIIIGLPLLLLAFLVGGCGAGQNQTGSNAKPTIVVGSKDFTEQIILGNMMAALLEKNGYNVVPKFNLGGTMVCATALKNGSIDVYPEYTGTSLVTILKKPVIHNANETYDVVKKDYKEKYDLDYLDRLGFNDTYALLMKKSEADKLGIKTISDLAAKADNLRFGTDQEFMTRPDGYPGLEKTYGLQFKQDNIKVMDAGLVYEALNSGDVDVIMGFSTDGRIPKLHLVTLTDDKSFFPTYDAAPVVRDQLLQKDPRIANILDELGGKISNEEMAQMNAAVDIDHQDPHKVAIDFLKSKGLM